MPIIHLKDGSQKCFNTSVTVHDVAASISPSLLKIALAAKVNHQYVDLDYLITDDVDLIILTTKDLASLDIIRHSTAHLLAQAVKRLFPEAQVTIGPVIADGFYYDFAFHRPFTPEDLINIEKQMHSIVQDNLLITHRAVSRLEATNIFLSRGETYKAEIIQAIPEHDTLSLYQQGHFIDLCRAPHVPSTKFLSIFKLTTVAGAYWRGDSNN